MEKVIANWLRFLRDFSMIIIKKVKYEFLLLKIDQKDMFYQLIQSHCPTKLSSVYYQPIKPEDHSLSLSEAV